jgi:hypothetical protein
MSLNVRIMNEEIENARTKPTRTALSAGQNKYYVNRVHIHEWCTSIAFYNNGHARTYVPHLRSKDSLNDRCFYAYTRHQHHRVTLITSTSIIERACSSETLVSSTYKITRHHKPEDHNLCTHRCAT